MVNQTASGHGSSQLPEIPRLPGLRVSLIDSSL
jgi:hypothetical protein